MVAGEHTLRGGPGAHVSEHGRTWDPGARGRGGLGQLGEMADTGSAAGRSPGRAEEMIWWDGTGLTARTLDMGKEMWRRSEALGMARTGNHKVVVPA